MLIITKIESYLKKKISNVLLGHDYGIDRACFYTQKGGYMEITAFKACARMVKQYVKNNHLNRVKLKMHTFPDFVLTAKPKEVRMGKGKGSISNRVALMYAGQKICTVLGLNSMEESKISLFLRELCWKLPLKATYRECAW